METATEVKTIQVDFKCPNCNDGYLRPTGMVYDTYPAKHPHLCNKQCGHGDTFNVTYPYIKHEPLTAFEQLRKIF